MKLINTDYALMENKVTVLLQEFAKDKTSREITAPHLAKISLLMNHLYQDLGFKSRVEMGRYMNKHFPKLAKQKPADKLWKKYIYELIDETAPACADCKDQINCFSCKL
jgi:nitrogen fixation protein NifQ